MDRFHRKARVSQYNLDSQHSVLLSLVTLIQHYKQNNPNPKICASSNTVSSFGVGNSLAYSISCFAILAVERISVSKNCDESSRNFWIEFILEKKA